MVSLHAYKWMKKVVDAGPKRAAWLRELQRARDQATAGVDARVLSEFIGVNEAVKRRMRVNLIVDFGRKKCYLGNRDIVKLEPLCIRLPRAEFQPSLR